MSFWEGKKILITGGSGFLGKALRRKFEEKGLSKDCIIIPKRPEHDLRSLQICLDLTTEVDIVIHLAANVGGIYYNYKYPATLLYENLQLGMNILEASRINGVKKLTIIGTTCSYPFNAPLPLSEIDLWNGYPAEATAAYGIAKKTIHELAKAYTTQYGLQTINLIPVNLYGPEDNFKSEDAHVIPALIQKFFEAKTNNFDKVQIWGTGIATREFLYIDDAAEGIIKATEVLQDPNPINLGSGEEVSIRQIANLISEISGFEGELTWDSTKPDGTLRRWVNTDQAEKLFNFKAQTKLIDGLYNTIEWYKNTF